MLFYPDQYFYNRLQHPRSKSSQQQRASQSRDPSNESGMPWAELFGGAEMQPSFNPRRGSYVPDEYVVLDEGELSALRAYRERQRRLADNAERREAIVARRRAEQQRRAMEAARQQEEARLQARVEAKARAAAREYVRRKQAQQIAIQRAQQEERQLRQQFILEQLRNQFGMFMVQPQSNAQDDGEENHDEENTEQEQRKSISEPQEGAQENGEEPQQCQDQIVDPIRTLLEALAPYPISFVASESSDEDEMKAEEEPTQSLTAEDAEKLERVEDGEEVNGPTCETASEEESEPAFVEFNDPFVNPPPQNLGGMSPSYGDDDDEFSSGGARKDRAKERQSVSSPESLKKPKHNESRRSSRRSTSGHSASSSKVTPVATAGQLNALEEDLKRLSEAFARLDEAAEPTSYQEAVSRVEGVKIGYRRTEEIYNKLDQMKTGKDYRKLKHQITANSVALADKYEELLQKANEVRKALIAKHNAENVKHQVTLEEVDDESDSI